ncbi:AAA family ATPase [Streptomyces sp. NPDC005077]|uniref:AAA family ATPase n=1 Tax=Streptomyces sp. NPDC005077 TaxID=3154292 RepID=UPI0033B6A45F
MAEPFVMDPDAFAALQSVADQFPPEAAQLLDFNKRFRNSRFAEALTRGQLDNLPQPEPLIDNTQDMRTLAFLLGRRSSAKSFIALDWSASIATGRAWMDRDVVQGRVFYVAAEGASGIFRRIQAWEQNTQQRVPDENFVVWPRPVKLSDSATVQELCDFLTAGQFSLIVFDTLARCSAGWDESSNKDMNELYEALSKVQEASGGTVLVLHHLGKDATRGARGASAIEDNADTVHEASRDARNGTYALKRTKTKEGDIDDSLSFNLVDVGPSAVLVPVTEREWVPTGAAHKVLSAIGEGVTVPELVAATELSDKAVRRALTTLEGRNLVETSGMRGKAPVWTGTDLYTQRGGSDIFNQPT